MSTDWTKIARFKSSEFPAGEIEMAEPELFRRLNAYAEALGSTTAVYPSPIPGALARTDVKAESSRHYAVGRLSDACDVFVLASLKRAWRAAVESKLFGGIGFYVGTVYKGVPWPMLHLDLRPQPLMWFCQHTRHPGGQVVQKYYYPAHGTNEEDTFFSALHRAEGPNLPGGR